MSNVSLPPPAPRSAHPALRRIVALSGAASFLTLLVGSDLSPGGGSLEISAAAVGADFRENIDRFMWSASFLLASVALLLIFLGSLWQRLQQGSAALAVVAVAGGAVTAAIWLLYAFLAIGAAVTGDAGDDQTARTIFLLEWASARVLAAPSLATVGAATVAGFVYAVFPAWFKFFSLVIVGLLLTALLPIGPAGLMGVLGALWLAVASLVLAIRPR